MSIIIALSLIVEFLYFFFYDFSKSRSRGARHFAIRAMAGATGTALVVLETLSPDPVDTRHFLLDIMAVVEILLMYPCSFEKPSVSLWTTLLIVAAVVLSFLFSLLFPSMNTSFRSGRIFFSYVVMLVVFNLYFLSVAYKRLGGIRLFFRNTAVWHNLEDYSRFMYSHCFLCLALYSVCAVLLPGNAGEIMTVTCVVLLMILYGILYTRDMTGRTLVLNAETEKKVKDIIKGNLRTSFIDKAEEDKKMNNLYNRVMLYMNEKKPYLDPSFHMEDMAGELYSNKLYLSRTINILSGRNFRQFINYHRIQYALSLFKKDPRLKVGEVASMSGFNSTVSFNMAFKVNTGKTPSEWLQEHSLERIGRL
ncbi:MAG: AraC family transcriptional regulator [Bacteroidales bacterium]|nr:AraC family transcriptional regulator [Bacteroidales bacterium]